MRFDSKMPMVEDVCRLQWLDARTCPIVSVALVRAHLPWWQQLIHRFHVWQRNECYLQIIITMSMHRADNVIYRNKCKINSKIEKRAFCFYCDQNEDPAWVFKWARTEHLHLCVVLFGQDLHLVKWNLHISTMRRIFQRSGEGSRISKCGCERYLQHEEKAPLSEQ